jgi:hypothetical protein
MQQGLALNAQVAQGNADRLQQFSENADRQRLQAEQVGLEMSPTGRDVYHAQTQQALLDQQFHQQANLQSMEMTQAEGLRLSRLNQAAAQVQDMVSRNELSGPEGRDLLLQINTGRSALQQKQAAAQIAAQQANTQRLQHEAAQQATMQAINKDFLAKLYATGKGTMVKMDANGNLHEYYIDEKGNPKPLAQAGKGEAEGKALSSGPAGNLGLTSKDVDKMFAEEMKNVDKLIHDKVDGKLVMKEGWTAEKQREAAMNRVKDRVAAMRDFTGQPQGQPQPGQQQPPPAATPEQRLAAPLAGWSTNPAGAETPQQKQVVSAFESGMRQLDARSDLSDDQKKQAKEYAQALFDLTRDYGSNMPAHKKVLYERYALALDKIVSGGK